MSDPIYEMTPGYLTMNGNLITDAALGGPTEWLENHVQIKDMLIAPVDLIGKYYDPRSKRAYINYNPSSGLFDDLVPLTHEDDKAVAIANAEAAKKNEIEIKACNWMIRFINDVIEADAPITETMIRNNANYVIIQLDTYLGDGNYTLTPVVE